MRMLVTLLAVSALSAQLSAQELPNPKPTKAHEVLARDAGHWDSEVSMFFAGPDAPPAKYKGVEVVELVSGGLFSRTTFKCQMGEREFEGHGLVGYDPRTKEYTGLWVDNFTSTPTSLKGKYDEEKKTLTMHLTLMDEAGREIKQKQLTTFVNENTKTFQIFLLVDAGGQELEIKVMEMTAKKRRSAGKKSDN